MSMVVVKREGEEGEITISEMHEQRHTIFTNLITASVVVSFLIAVFILVMSDQHQIPDCYLNIITNIFIGCLVYSFGLGFLHFLSSFGDEFVPCYYIRSYYMSKTIPKTSDQKAICDAVREIDEETQKALEKARLEKARLQVVANRCK